MTTKQRHDTHATPEIRDTWRELAIKALPKLEGKPLRYGPVEEGERGAYAARRVYWRDDPGRSSALIVARDEANATLERTRLEGVDWWPNAIWGCYHGCGPTCPRHGEDHPAGGA